jgi:hypothetical protein
MREQVRVNARGAAIIAAVVLTVIGGLYAIRPHELTADGALIVNEPCAGFEQPTTVELRISDDDSRYGSLTRWQAFGGAPMMCAAGFAFGELPEVDRYELRAGSYVGSFTQPGSRLAISLTWTAEGALLERA